MLKVRVKRLAAFRVLIEFANLEDLWRDGGAERWRKFRRKYPWFILPVSADSEANRLHLVTSLHQHLRQVLDGRDPSGELLKTLLGIDPEPIVTMKLGDRVVGTIKASASGPDLYVSGISEKAPPDGERAPRLQRIGRGLNYQEPELTAEKRLRLVGTEVRMGIPVPLKGIIVPAQFAPIWHTSRFEYRPRVVFQQILYELWKQSWRARRCPRCRSYFVADRAARLYCSLDCGSSERALRNADYWREHKDKINASRRRGKE